MRFLLIAALAAGCASGSDDATTTDAEPKMEPPSGELSGDIQPEPMRGCEPPQALCDGACANTMTSTAHCGACGHACATGDVCLMGDCVADCAELTACGASCVDLDGDRENCGECGEACPADRECRGGACVCPAGHVLCGTACVALSTDAAHCGACESPCAEGEICEGGDCTIPIPPEADCNDALDNDEDALFDCEDPDCWGATRSCDASCGVGIETCGGGEWGACEGTSGPTEEICGDGVDQDCDGGDLRAPDEHEPNDSCEACREVGGEDPSAVVLGRFDSVDDIVDCYKFNAVDNWYTGETVRVELMNMPDHHDYALYLFRGETSCHDLDFIGESDNEGSANESISWPERFGWDDTETYYVRIVRKRGHDCASNYTLSITGLQ